MGLSFVAATKLVAFKNKAKDFAYLANPMSRHWPHDYAEILAELGYDIVRLEGYSYDDLDYSSRKFFAGCTPHEFEESWLIVAKDGIQIKIPANELAGKKYKI